MKPHGELTDFECRHPDGSLKITTIARHIAFCHRCQFRYREKGCLFAPASTSAAAFGKYSSAKPASTHRAYAPRRKAQALMEKEKDGQARTL